MRTRRTTSLLGCLAASMFALHVGAQTPDWSTGGNSVLGGEYLGANGSSIAPLLLQTVPNLAINFRTNGILRMRLTETLTGQSVNGYTNLDLSGHLGIGNFNAPVYTPLTMVHLDSLGSEVAGYRSYMGTGILMTALSDMMYVGLKRLTDDRINSVINWADNEDADSTYGPDALSFVFTSELDNTNAAGRQHGLV